MIYQIENDETVIFGIGDYKSDLKHSKLQNGGFKMANYGENASEMLIIVVNRFGTVLT